MKNDLIKKIEKRESIVGIIGLGYVGLPLAREFLKKKFKVTGFDVDPEKVRKINSGESYIRHIKDDFIREFVLEKSMFYATADFSKLVDVDVIIICVPTPLGKHQDPDLSFVLNTTHKIAEFIRKGQVVILESTTYPGTTEDEMLPLFENKGLKVGRDFFLGYSPEREDPGNREFSTSAIPKIVSGITPGCREIIEFLYRQVVVKVVPVSSPRIAEAAKILENTYRAVNIALVNELKTVFDRMQIDVWEVIDAAASKPFGFHSFYPGPGLGGHCIPIDPFYLTWKAKEFDIHTRFIELAGEINNNMPYFVVDKVIRALNSLGQSMVGSRILLVGLAYKPDLDELRESPSFWNCFCLRRRLSTILIPIFPLSPKPENMNSASPRLT
jgi:UDP-N-acetyl-D-glucosamine dehydrogenase